MWRYTSARATGTSHVRLNLPCQDRCGCSQLASGGFVAALADGAGSAEFSEEGAEIVVKEVIDYVTASEITPSTDLGTLIRDAAIKGREAVVQLAVTRNSDPRAFASTLLAIFSTDYGSCAIQIGDGVIVIAHAEGEWEWIFWPQRGEYANTTRFLTDPDALDHIQVETISNPLLDISLTSDGLESLGIHYASRTVHSPFFSGLLSPLLKTQNPGHDDTLSSSLASYLGSPTICDRTDDDVCIVLATRRPITVSS